MFLTDARYLLLVISAGSSTYVTGAAIIMANLLDG
jgi:hypothetical protein